MSRSGWADLLEGQEDRGVKAVTDALERIGVAWWNPERQCWTFRHLDVAGETLNREVSRALGRLS